MRVGAIVTANPERQAEARRDFPDALMLSQPQDVWEAPDRFDLVVIATRIGLARGTGRLRDRRGHRGDRREADGDLGCGGASRWPSRPRRTTVLLVPFLNRRWDSDHLTLIDLLAEGRLGTVLRYEFEIRALATDGLGRGGVTTARRRWAEGCCSTSAPISSTRR